MDMKKIKWTGRIGNKVFLALAPVLSIVLIVMITVAVSGIKNYAYQTAQEQADRAVKSLASTINTSRIESERAAAIMAGNPAVKQAVENKNLEQVLTAVRPLLPILDMDFVTVSDSRGNVIARSHQPEKSGDNVRKQRNIQLALEGSLYSAVEQGTVVPLAARAGAPVYSNGVLVGAVSIGRDLSRPAMVDKIKEQFGADATIFHNDTRLTTTIMKDGERMVGTKLDPVIAEKVLINGASYNGKTGIMGMPYITTYLPLLDDRNKVIGVIFAGKPVAAADIVVTKMTILLAVVSLLSLVVIAFMIYFILSRSVIKPIAMITKTAQAIAQGNIHEDFDLEEKGEFGQVVAGFKSIVAAFNRIIEETTALSNASIEGRLYDRGNVENFEGDYKKVIKGFNLTMDAMVGYIDKMPAPVMVIDNDFNIRYMNEAGIKLLNSTKTQLVGSKCYNHFKTGDCGTGKCACGRAMSEGRIANSETDAHPVGLDLEIAYTGVPIKDQSGKTVGAFELVTDQTGIKKAQKLSQKISDYQSQAVTVVSKALEKLSQGDLNIDVEVGKGDSDTIQVRENFLTITKAISQTTEAVKQMSNETDILVTEAVKGNLYQRADSAKHLGAYRRIVDGLNTTLETLVSYIDKMPAPVMVIDNDFNIRYMNEAGIKLLNSTKTQLVGSKCYNHFKTGDCGTGKCACGRAMSEGRIANSETDAHPVGLDLEIAYTGVPIKDQSGKTVGAFELVTDQTGIKKAQKLSQKISDYQSQAVTVVSKALEKLSQGDLNIDVEVGKGDSDTIQVRENFLTITKAISQTTEAVKQMSNETDILVTEAVKGNLYQRADSAKHLGAYRRIVDGLNTTLETLVSYIDKMPAPVMVIDNDFNIRYMNEAGIKLLNSTKTQLVGSKCYNHFKTGDCGTGKCACGRAMSEGRIANSETDAHPVGLDLEIAYTGVPIKDQSGKTVGAFELVTDQTGIKKAQKLSQKISDYQSQAVTVVSKALEKLSQGDLNIDVEVGKGDSDTIQVRENFLTITKAISQTTEAVKQMTGDVNYLTQTALEGRLSTRADDKKHHGEYMNIVQGINNILDAVVIPMNETAEVLEKIAAKDLTSRMKGDYRGDLAKIKEAMNTAADNLDKALQQVAIGAEQVASASVQVSTGGQALSQGTSEQASSLEEVSSSLQEMSSMTKQNTTNAKEAKGVADQTRESSEKGVESMSRLSSAINKIKASSDSTAKIVKTIDEIAFQTNLLALNAAVEAARAGDAGKGFAVVAEEVRNLAMRSAEAAKNTANLIEDAVKNSENGVAINAEVLKNFQEINERTNKVSQVVAEIAAASEQQDQGISQVNKAVEQMNQVTQQNAANAEESASAAEEMSSASPRRCGAWFRASS